MGKQRLVMTAAAALTLSACGMFAGLGSDRSTHGDGSDTGKGNEAVAECRGLSGTALRECLDRQGLNRASERAR